MKPPRHRCARVAAMALALAGLAVAVAYAGTTVEQAFPGKNGRIVFNDRSGNLLLVNADGTGLVRLARTNAPDWVIGASFSPTGRQIAYSDGLRPRAVGLRAQLPRRSRALHLEAPA